MGDDRVTNVAELKPGMKGVSCLFIVLDIGEPTKTKEGHTVRSVLVADRTASISLSVWDEWGEAVRSGDILKLTKGYASLWKGSLTLYIGRTGVLQKVGEFTMVFSDTPNMSEKHFDGSGIAGSNESFVGQSQSGGESQSFVGKGSSSTDQRHIAHVHHQEVAPPQLGPRPAVSSRHQMEGHGGLRPLMGGERIRQVHRPGGRNHLHGHYSQRPQAEQPRNNHW